MKEFKNFIIPDDVYYLIIPYIDNKIKINELTKKEFLEIYDSTVIILRKGIINNWNTYTNIQFEKTYPNNIYYLVLSNNTSNKRVCQMSKEKFIEIFDKAIIDLRKDILSNDEYYQLLENGKIQKI